jgi:rubrerythrin
MAEDWDTFFDDQPEVEPPAETEAFAIAVALDREARLREIAERIKANPHFSKEDKKKHLEDAMQMVNNAEYRTIDTSRRVDTSVCNHSAIVDETLPDGRNHWICTLCGRGKYSTDNPWK